MAKIFLAYRHTGEDLEELRPILKSIKSALSEAGHEVTNAFDYDECVGSNCLETGQVYQFMLRKQENTDVFMAFVRSDARSKGMQMESEKAVQQGQRYVLLKKQGVSMPEFEGAAHETIRFSTHEELLERLKTFI